MLVLLHLFFKRSRGCWSRDRATRNCTSNRVAGAGIDPTSYQQFMNPFMEDVIARTQQDIADKGAQQQLQAQASAVGSGAFGGSRQAVLQGQIAADVMDQQARTGAQLRSQGFQQAQNLAQQVAQQQLKQAQLTSKDS